MAIPNTTALAALAQRLTGINPVGLGDVAVPFVSNTPGTFCTTVADGTFTIYLKDGSGITIQSAGDPSTGEVTSFNTRTGAVVLTAGDLNTLMTLLAAADGTVTIGGTKLAPTVKVATGGITNTQISAAAAIAESKIANPGSGKLIGDTDGGTTTGAVTVGTGLSLSGGTLSSSGASNPMTQPGQMITGGTAGVETAISPSSAGQAPTSAVVNSFEITSTGAHEVGSATDTGLPTGNAPWTFGMRGKLTDNGTDFLFAYGSGPSVGIMSQGGLRIISPVTGGGINDGLTSPVNDGLDHDLIVTYNGTTVIAYVDGVNSGSIAEALTTALAGAGGFKLGASGFGSDWIGSMERVFFLSTALSSGDVAAIAADVDYSARDTLILSHSPLHYWKLQEASGNFTDVGSLANTLTAGASGITYHQAGTLTSTSVAFSSIVQDSSYTNVQGGVGFTNSWVDAGGALAPTGFRKGVGGTNGRVDLRISMNTGATATAAFTLPAGYRPANTETLVGVAEESGVNIPVKLSITSGGIVTPVFTGALTGNVYVSGSFWNGA